MQEIHEDMKRNFESYPKLWGLKKPDPNIDHRRVPNIVTFLTRRAKAVEVSQEGVIIFPEILLCGRFRGS